MDESKAEAVGDDQGNTGSGALEDLEALKDEGSEREGLENEVAELRRRLVDTPRQIHLLESEARDASRELARSNARNQKLAATIEAARERITVLRDEVEKLSQPP
ncbi:MAG: hypothetical protein HOH27_01135, partial [Acidimicrobiaceae bacterium]|nr:hypothetical protein [Acidimicrobiaceae bacterium]